MSLHRSCVAQCTVSPTDRIGQGRVHRQDAPVPHFSPFICFSELQVCANCVIFFFFKKAKAFAQRMKQKFACLCPQILRYTILKFSVFLMLERVLFSTFITLQTPSRVCADCVHAVVANKSESIQQLQQENLMLLKNKQSGMI